jgi:glycosidase
MRINRLLSLIVIGLLTISCVNQPTKQEEISLKGMHPEWVYDAVIYEVNTRQFTPEGTFKAFANHLPRLQELGVDILWFMPIQTIGEKDRKGSLGSYYSIKNYIEVNSEFGTLEDFKEAVETAQSMGMKVILDWVANHTSRDAVWVNEHPEWYVRDSLGDLNVMYDWTDIAQLDYSIPEMREKMIESMMFWVEETGINGFRCDVAGELPTDFWEVAKDSLLAINNDLFFLAEAEKPELNESAFDAYYAWDFHHKMNSVAQGKEPVDSLRVSLERMLNSFPKHAIPMYFTSNHDENSWNGTEFERMGDAVQIFAALTYVLPGMPLIYNGQEASLDKRLEFFEKDLIDFSDNDDFTGFYKMLNSLKKQHPALQSQERDGSMSEISNNHPQKVWSFKRSKGESEIVAIFNLSRDSLNATLEEDFKGVKYSNLNDSTEVEITGEVALQPWEYKILYR